MMRTKLFLEEFRKNWIIISLGSILFAIGFFVINANEGEHKGLLIEDVFDS